MISTGSSVGGKNWSYDTVARHGGRVVKTIGDEVMFVGLVGTGGAHRGRAACTPRLGRSCPRFAPGSRPEWSIARDGDYYGPVVNLASRLTDRAAGRDLASEELHAELADDPSFVWRRSGRTAAKYRRRRACPPVGRRTVA